MLRAVQTRPAAALLDWGPHLERRRALINRAYGSMGMCRSHVRGCAHVLVPVLSATLSCCIPSRANHPQKRIVLLGRAKLC